MKTNIMLFIDTSIIYYFGLKNILLEINTQLIFFNVHDVKSAEALAKHEVECICFHILDDTDHDLLVKNIKKLKRLFPKAKIVVCLNEFNRKVLSVINGFEFNGYFMAEDSAEDIVAFVSEILKNGVGMSKKMAKNYVSVAQKKHTGYIRKTG